MLSHTCGSSGVSRTVIIFALFFKVLLDSIKRQEGICVLMLSAIMRESRMGQLTQPGGWQRCSWLTASHGKLSAEVSLDPLFHLVWERTKVVLRLPLRVGEVP